MNTAHIERPKVTATATITRADGTVEIVEVDPNSIRVDLVPIERPEA